MSNIINGVFLRAQQSQQTRIKTPLNPKYICLICLVTSIVIGSGWRLAKMLHAMGYEMFMGGIVAIMLALFGFLLGMVYEGLNHPKSMKYGVVVLAGISILLYLFTTIPVSSKFQTTMMSGANQVKINDFGTSAQLTTNQIKGIGTSGEKKSYDALLQFMAQPFVGALLLCLIEMLSVAAVHFIWEDLELSQKKSFLRGIVKSLQKEIKDNEEKLAFDNNQINGLTEKLNENATKKPLTKQEIDEDPFIQVFDSNILKASNQILKLEVKLKSLSDVKDSDKAIAKRFEDVLAKVSAYQMDIFSPEYLAKIRNTDEKKFLDFALDCFLKS